jgi:hypothetical protein
MKTMFRGQEKTDEQIEIENQRAAAIESFKSMSAGRARRKLTKLYDHLPADAIKYITKVFFKHNKN